MLLIKNLKLSIMIKNISRRDFIKKGTIATYGMSFLPLTFGASNEMQNSVKIGIIGTGSRGTGLLRLLLSIDDSEIVALNDVNKSNAENAANLCQEAGRNRPRIYSEHVESYKQLLDEEKLDCVIIATPWHLHVAPALYAMKNGVYPGIEVPMALTIDDTWQLVEMSEKTGIPCMMLENWSFRKDNLALLNMKRLGMFGEIVHCHSAHSHDVRSWYFERKWPVEYLLNYNRDLYPCHSVGPIPSWMDINCGDVFTEIYSEASAQNGITDWCKREFGEDHPKARMNYRQGDIVTSVLRTKMGKTLVVNNDMQLPRPYSNRWLLQGLKGVYDEEKESIYLEDYSPSQGRQWEPFKPYEEKYNHKWHYIPENRDRTTDYFHGGVDYIMLVQFIDAVRAKGPTPLDVYDSAVMTAIIELSGISIAKKAPVAFPDFTKGKWQTKKPYFAMDKFI